MVRKFVGTCLAVIVCSIALIPGASAEVTVTLQLVAEGLTAPLIMVSPPDGTNRRFIVEQIGQIRILNAGREAGRRAVPQHPPPDRQAPGGLRRARSPRAGVPSRLQEQREVLRLVQRVHPERRPREDGLVVAHQLRRRVPGLEGQPEQGRSAERADDHRHRLAAVQPQRPLDRLRAGRLPVHLDRRRRLRQRLGHRPQRDQGERPGPRQPARQDPPGRRRQGRSPTPSRRTTRSSAARTPSPRSGRTASATPGGAPSTWAATSS